MTTHRFYCPSLKAGRCVLGSDDTQHARRVLRLQVGDTVELFDGQGGLATGTLLDTAKAGASVDVPAVHTADPPAGPQLTLLTALPRQPRQPFLFEKATELGVHAIHPTIFARSTVMPKGSSIGKWHRTTIEAAKQSGCLFLPHIAAPTPLTATLTTAPPADLRLVADIGSEHPPLDALLVGHGRDQRICLWIGPEGGLTDEERAALANAGVASVSLGPNILRIETAGITAAGVCALRRNTPGGGPRSS